MSNISRVKISALGKTITGKTPSSNNPEDFGSDYMFVTPSDSFDKKMMNLTERYLSEEGVQKLSSKLLPPNSIMVTCIGSAMGKVSMNETSCVTNQQINSIVPNNNFDPHYIYYTIKNNYKVLRNAATGSTAVPLLNKTDFDILELLIHKDLPTQKSIAKVLSDLDAKIELNNRINRELEAMAKTLYDYWFVQFDFPFDFAQGKPNEQGKPYKSSGGKMVYNAELKREIPEGWEAGTLGKIAELIRGVTYDSSEIKDENDEDTVPVLRATNITGNVLDLDNMVYVPRQNVSKIQLLNRFDILITMSSGSKEHIGKNGFYYFDKEVSFGAFCAKIVAKKDFRYYLYSYTQSEFMFATIKNECLGTNINNLNGSLVKGFKLVLPPIDLIKKFNEKVQSIYETIGNNHKQNQHLTALRDWLLPMLMNGQVTVRQAHGNAVQEAEERLSMAAEPSVEYKKG